MPQQLIFTSAPRGIVAGRSGYCTVAHSLGMRDALILHLEKLSYYQHAPSSGAPGRPIHTCRVVDLRGTRYHVISRICDAGLDFTGRTNFLAHHVVFSPDEARRMASPAVVLCNWEGWRSCWTAEPEMMAREDWGNLNALAKTVSVPARCWKQLSGEETNGYGLLEIRSGATLRVDGLEPTQVLRLLAESLELLELRDPRRDFRGSAWQFSFTTSLQAEDNPSDFRWRCIYAKSAGAVRITGDSQNLLDLRPARVTSEESVLAREGRRAPRFVAQPQHARATEGQPVVLRVQIEGVPRPSCQWYAVDRAGNGEIIANGLGEELTLTNAPVGVSRYVARASNSEGDATSDVTSVSIEPKMRLVQSQNNGGGRLQEPAGASYIRSAEKIENQRRRLELQKAEAQLQRIVLIKRCLSVLAILLLLAVTGALLAKRNRGPRSTVAPKANTSNAVASAPSPAVNTNSPLAGEGTNSSHEQAPKESQH